MSRIKTESKVATLIKSDLRAGEGTEGLSDQQKRELVLTELHDRLNDRKETSLRPGILAQWKPGLKNRTSPAYGEPVIVVAILNPPIFDDSFQSGSVYYREVRISRELER
jgi:hypothetical protein